MPSSIENTMPSSRTVPDVAVIRAAQAVDAHAVARAVHEIFAIAGIGDDFACSKVDILCQDARSCRLQRCLHGLFNDGVNVFVAFRRQADDGDACDVAVKSALEGVVFLNHPIACRVMRKCAVRSGADDPE